MTMPEKTKGLNVSLFTIIGLLIVSLVSLALGLIFKIFPLDHYDVGGMSLSFNIFEALMLVLILLRVGKEEGL